jgi:formylglycine-generating enzyme required for sulfatase activity
MAPEQTDRKGRICPATDVWALGLIAFKLLAGRDFWREADGSLPMLLREICVDPIPFATARAAELRERPLAPGEHPVPELPPGFDAWFARCVIQNLDARFADAGECVRAFMELVTIDASRGALVALAGGEGLSGSGFITTGIAPRRGQLSVRVTSSEGPIDPRAATGVVPAVTGMTAAPITNKTGGAASAASSSGMARAGLAVAAIAVAAAGVFAYRTFGAGTPPQPPSTAAAMPPSVTTGASAPAPATVAAQAGTCADGMVPIPGGKMFMGARDLSPNTKPPHEVTVSAFCLDKTEVTTRAYLACVEKGECERPPDKVSWPGITDQQSKVYSSFCNAAAQDRADHPINCVAWSMAQTFCAKRSARLPTEAEWEFAARGASQRKFPWGDDTPSAKYLNACGKQCVAWFAAHGEKKVAMYDDDDSFVGTAPVGSFPLGASSFGVLDLAGNVWEWTADWFGLYSAEPAVDPKGPPTGTQRVARGGDFTGGEADWARPAFRWKTDPETFNHAIGFRCASAPK